MCRTVSYQFTKKGVKGCPYPISLQGCVVSLRPEICELIKLLLKLTGTFEIQSDIIC